MGLLLGLPIAVPCTCGYLERAESRQANWDAPDAIGYPWPPYPVWHYPDCLMLPDYPFLPMSNPPTCPKCTSTDIRTTFHDESWHYRPHHHDYWRSDLNAWSCLLTFGYRPAEHLDRDCQVCRFGWLERTAVLL